MNSLHTKLPKKVDLRPKKHHGFQVFLWALGMLLPPLAIAARFGIGTDFFINVILTIAGYFPGHFHNFYCQNIRNNTNRGRTPKWAIKAGLINTDDQDRRKKKNQWAKRFDERNNQSAHIGQALEEGEEGEDYVPVSEQEEERRKRAQREGLWNDDEDADYYNEDQAPNQRHWHYPANFEGAASGTGRKKLSRKASNNADRWERTRASRSDSNGSDSTYPPAAVDHDVPEWGKDYGSKRRSSKSNRKNQAPSLAQNNSWQNGNAYADDVAREDGWGNGSARGGSQPQKKSSGRSDDVFNHEF